MKNFLNKDLIPESTTLYCFWCRHSFNYKPIGCPIDYVPPRISKSYHSEITKDKYILRENITPIQLKELDTLNNLNENEFNEFSIIDNDFYVTDGLFCSFNCTLAYIKLNHDNPLYINSECLLNKMYFDTFGGNCIPLIEAPSWRLLKNYGGHMDIEEYRKNFFKVNYLNIDNIVYPKTKCVGYVFEKQIKL
jgi:hypothetical protein